MVRLVGLKVERSKNDRQSGNDPGPELADRRVGCDGHVGAGREARTDPSGLMFRVGVISRGRVARAGVRPAVVVVEVVIEGVIVVAGRAGRVIHDGIMGPLVRQTGDRRRDHQPASQRSQEPSRQGSDHHGLGNLTRNGPARPLSRRDSGIAISRLMKETSVSLTLSFTSGGQIPAMARNLVRRTLHGWLVAALMAAPLAATPGSGHDTGHACVHQPARAQSHPDHPQPTESGCERSDACQDCATPSCHLTGQCGASLSGMLSPEAGVSLVPLGAAVARLAGAELTSITTDPPTRPPLLTR